MLFSNENKNGFRKLLKKKYGMGVRGSAYDWFALYLRNRTQYVE